MDAPELIDKRSHKQSDARWAWIIVIILIVAGLLIKGIVAWQKDARTAYPAEYGTNFMNSCTSSGSGYSYCACALKYVQDTYTYPDALEMERNGSFSSIASTVSYICS